MGTAHVRACRGVARRFPVAGEQLLDLWEADKGHDGVAGGAVSSWRSQGRLQRHLAQATGTKKPTFNVNAGFGTPRMTFDGGDCIHATGAGMDGRTKAGWVLITRFAAAVNDYIFSEPDATAGTNGVDCRTRTTSGTISFVNQVGGSNAVNLTSASHAAAQTAYELLCDLDRSAHEITMTSSAPNWAYATAAGTAIDADSATISLGDFSNAGFSSPFVGDILALALLGEGMGPGQRRRMYRYARRRWNAPPPADVWRDGTLAYAL